MNKVIFIFLLLSSYCFSQTENSEKIWLINFYFDANKSENKQLSDVYTLTIKGKYNEAKAIIYKAKASAVKNSLFYSALLNYEASISYNESHYQYSISLCDSSVSILNKIDAKNRFIIKAKNAKAKALCALNEFNEAEEILRKNEKEATEIGDKNGLSVVYYLLGALYSDKGEYLNSNDFLLKSIELKKEIKDELGLSATYSFLGTNYAHLGNYMQGIELIQNSITIREKNNDKRGLANSYLSLYKIYIDIGEADKAIESELKSLEICKEINDLQCVSGRLTNLGKIYQDKGNYQQAILYHYLALDISKKINIKNRVAEVHENIAKNFNYKGKYSTALLHLDSCIKIRETIGDPIGLVSAKLTLAEINYNQNKYENASLNGRVALAEAQKLNLAYLIKDAHQLLSNTYELQNNKSEALYHYKKYIILRDSLYNIDKTKEIVRKELEFNFNRKEELQKLETAKKIEKVNAERRKQKTIIIASVIGIIILSSLLLFAIWQYRQKIKSEKQLQKLNSDLNFKNHQLNEKTHIIELQHNTIHQKNKEITDSIRYAQKIQTAMMPLKSEFAQFFKSSFVFFEPKDIISGDFFWITEKNGKIIFATGDCTGHGVPGGFMSMLGVSLLNEIINEHELTEPALILSRLRKKVIKALRQKGLSGEQQDGMDMTICVIDKAEMEMQYAAANHSFYIIRKTNQEYVLHEFSGDKQPVGIFGQELKPFKQHSIKLLPNDVIYTLTDGYADQFGGPKGKKFKYKQLKELLLSIQELPLNEQEEKISKTFNAWKNNLEQVDDVTLIGISI